MNYHVWRLWLANVIQLLHIHNALRLNHLYSIYDYCALFDWCAGHFKSCLLLNLEFDLKVVLQGFDARQCIRGVLVEALLHSSVLRVLKEASLCHKLFLHLKLLSRHGLLLKLGDESTLAFLALLATLLNLLAHLTLVHGPQLLLDDDLLHLVNHGHFRHLILAVDLVNLLQHSLLLLEAYHLKVGLDLMALLIVLEFAIAHLSGDSRGNGTTFSADSITFLRRLDQFPFTECRISSLFNLKCLFKFFIIMLMSFLNSILYRF